MQRFLLIIFILLPLILQANIINVPEDYPNIQAAISAAEDGDVIIVEPGRYQEAITFLGKKITVASRYYTDRDRNHIANTIIDGNQEYYSVVTFDNQETRDAKLIGFTVTGGYADGDMDHGQTFSYSGGGIYSGVLSTPTISDCIITENYAKRGGGISYMQGASIKNSEISYNIASDVGGGIFGLVVGAEAIIDNCEIHHNVALKGGGMLLLGHSQRVRNTTIHNNRALKGEGGGVALMLSEVEMENCVLYGNQAENGAAIYTRGFSTEDNPKSLHLINCTIADNKAEKAGGAIFIDNGENCFLVNTVSYDNYPQEIAFSRNDTLGNIAIAYSNIRGGEWAIAVDNPDKVEWLNGNFFSDPLFVDQENHDYRLTSDSPCVEAGTERFVSDDGKTIVDIERERYPGMAPDIGAMISTRNDEGER